MLGKNLWAEAGLVNGTKSIELFVRFCASLAKNRVILKCYQLAFLLNFQAMVGQRVTRLLSLFHLCQLVSKKRHELCMKTTVIPTCFMLSPSTNRKVLLKLICGGLQNKDNHLKKIK